MTGLRIIFAGTPQFAVPALRAIAESRHGVVGVLTQPDRPSGRGQKLTASAVKLASVELGLEVRQPATLKTEEGRATLAGWHADVMVVVAYGLILPREILALPRLGCVNIHASLLPRWRGAAPIQRAILAGDEESGITIMQMDAGLDTGPMLLQKRTKIDARETSASLHDRLAGLGATTLLEALDGTMQSKPQPQDGVTYAAKIEKAEALIDWNREARQIERQIRAFDPWPVAETRWAGEPLKVHSAHLIDETKAAVTSDIDAPVNQLGAILGVKGDAILVRCGRGVLAITSVQRPGRRPVSAAEFARSITLTGQRFG